MVKTRSLMAMVVSILLGASLAAPAAAQAETIDHRAANAQARVRVR